MRFKSENNVFKFLRRGDLKSIVCAVNVEYLSVLVLLGVFILNKPVIILRTVLSLQELIVWIKTW